MTVVSIMVATMYNNENDNDFDGTRIYFSGGGSCDGGFNFGCNYVHYKTMRMTMILMVHVFTSVVVVVVTVVPQLLHTVVTGSLSYTTLE